MNAPKEQITKDWFISRLEKPLDEISPIERALISLWEANGYEHLAIEAAAELEAMRAEADDMKHQLAHYEVAVGELEAELKAMKQFYQYFLEMDECSCGCSLRDRGEEPCLEWKLMKAAQDLKASEQ
jgi:hypothetical protein